MARFFLTGATGFVGSHVAEKLVEGGHQLYCLVRKTSNLHWIQHLPLELVTGQLSQPESYKEILPQVDYVVHVAGVTKAFRREDYYRGNVENTRFLLETIEQSGSGIKKFLYVSSQAAVGPSPTAQAIDETFSPKPITDYGKSKLLAEQLVREHADRLPITIVRPPAVYGPRDTDVLHFFKNLKSGWNVQVGNIDQLVSLVYVEDLAVGIREATMSANTTGNTYFVCEEQAYRWSFVASVAARILQVTYRTVKIPYPLAYAVAGVIEWVGRLRGKPTILNRQKMREVRQQFWVVSPQRAKRDFGYQTHFPLNRGIEATIQWYRGMGWL